MKNKVIFFTKYLLKLIIGTAVTFSIFCALIILILRFINPPTTAFMLIKSGITITSPFSSEIQKQKWASINNISKSLSLAVISSEDQKFMNHFGFDLKQIEIAISERENGRRVRGASTISQQVVKNLFLSGDKNFLRKIIEAELTILVEILWSKKRILEVYLNIAEFGKNIYGAEAAANFYFKKAAENLNRSEAALLAAVLPSPIRYSVSNPSNFLNTRKNRILNSMDMMGGINSIKTIYE